MFFYRKLLVAVVMALCAQTQAAEPEGAVVRLRSTVSGNQELPKMMYILPWQASRGAVSEYGLEAGIAQELFQPLDRDEFQREISYGEIHDPEHAAGTD